MRGQIERELHDGVGGAQPRGRSFVGPADRLAVFDGHLRVKSPPDGGTLVTADIPSPDDESPAGAGLSSIKR